MRIFLVMYFQICKVLMYLIINPHLIIYISSLYYINHYKKIPCYIFIRVFVYNVPTSTFMRILSEL